MKFRPIQTFWEAYADLPADIKEQARTAFQRFQEGAVGGVAAGRLFASAHLITPLPLGRGLAQRAPFGR